MLVLGRKEGEIIVIDPDGRRIEIMVVRGHGNSKTVRIGVTAPGLVVHRGEVWDQILKERKKQTDGEST
jgi:carbon storage regulator CsrA